MYLEQETRWDNIAAAKQALKAINGGNGYEPAHIEATFSVTLRGEEIVSRHRCWVEIWLNPNQAQFTFYWDECGLPEDVVDQLYRSASTDYQLFEDDGVGTLRIADPEGAYVILMAY